LNIARIRIAWRLMDFLDHLLSIIASWHALKASGPNFFASTWPYSSLTTLSTWWITPTSVVGSPSLT
jgi:hypothetical protein